MTDNLEKIVNRLEVLTTKLENLPQLHQNTTNTENTENMNFICTSNNQITIEYDNIISGELKSYEDLSNKIGGDVANHAKMVHKVMSAQLEFIKKCTTHSKPQDSQLQTLLKPTSEAIEEIVKFRESNRRSAHFNHLSAVSEAIPAFGWVTVSPTPCPYMKEMQDASVFYTNRVLKDFRDKDQTHVDWTKSWLSVLNKLQAFVKKNYTTGITWNMKGSPVGAGGASAPPPPAGCGVPPPPPPPPPAPVGDSGSDSRAELFAEINKGGAVTTGLRKVTDDMKTHKNPNLRAGNTVGDIKSKSGGSVQAKEIVRPPSQRLEGNKWTLEYFKNSQNLVVDNTEMKHIVMIHKCVNCIVTIKGKINSIMIDNCSKLGIVFDGLIAGLDIVNSKGIKAQTLGTLALVNIDKTDGAQIFLNKESMGAEIISAKSSEMNISYPDVQGEMVELPVPEQFKSKIVNGKLVTTCTEDL